MKEGVRCEACVSEHPKAGYEIPSHFFLRITAMFWFLLVGWFRLMQIGGLSVRRKKSWPGLSDSGHMPSSAQNKMYVLGWEQKYTELLIASLSLSSQSRVFKRQLNERFRCYVYNDCLGGCALRCVFFLNTTWRRPPLTYIRPNKQSFP